jgi:hypothetical protein
MGELLAISGLAITAQLEGQFDEAAQYQRLILEEDRRKQDHFGMANDLAYLACIAVYQHDMTEAAHCISEGLRLALAMQVYPVILKHMVAGTLWKMRRQDAAEAAALLAIIRQHPGCTVEVGELAEPVRAELAAQHVSLPSSLNYPPIETVAAQLLHELDAALAE